MNRKDLRVLVAKLKRKQQVNLCDFKIFLYRRINYLHKNTYSRVLKAFSDNPAIIVNVKKALLPQRTIDLLNTKLTVNQKIDNEFFEHWIMFCFKICKEQLIRFNNLKQIYESHIYKLDYQSAADILEKIESEVCVSLWSISQRFIIEEYTKGLESHKLLLDEYIKQSRKRVISEILLDFISNLAESNMSYLNYQDKAVKFLSSIKQNKLVYEYINYKINLEYEYDIEQTNIIYQFEEQFSVVDLYESVVNHIINRTFKEGISDNIVCKIYSITGDFRLLNLQIINGVDVDVSKNLYNQTEYNEILECYTYGDYQRTIQLIDDYTQNNSLDFQLLILQIKSHLSIGHQFISNIDLVNHIYSLYSFNKDLQNTTTLILDKIKQYAFLGWRHKLIGLVSRKVTLKNIERTKFFSQVNDEKLSPNMVCLMKNKINQIKYLQITSEFYKYTSNLYSFILGFEEHLSDEIIDMYRKNIYLAAKYIKLNMNEEAIEILHKLEKSTDENDAYHYEKIVRFLFTVYTNQKDIGKLIKVAVKAYFINENFISKLHLVSVSRVVKNVDSNEIFKCIDYPIFTYISDKNNLKQLRIAYANFMDSNMFNDITLIGANYKCSKDKMILFLHEICSIDIVKKDINVLTKGKSAEEIRICLLYQLEEIDSTHIKVYEDEISEITKKIGIRTRISQINKSRIYVDTAKINSETKAILAENYAKYLQIKKFNSKPSGIDLNNRTYTENVEQLVSDVNERIRTDVNFSQEMVVLANIITRITEEFLFNSKYGLETFLSSRIRHGYCKDTLISAFNECKLISKKTDDSSNDYIINEYWDNILPKLNTESELFRANLSIFTRNIESKIDEIRGEWVRIKFYKNTKGLFDFSYFVTNALMISFDNIAEYNVFYKEIIEFLWKWVENSLTIIRGKIENELKQYFYSQLTLLENQMKNLKDNLPEYTKEVCYYINLCKSKLEVTIQQFSDVFYVVNNNYKEFIMIDLLDVCLQICEKLFTDFNKIKVNKNIKINDIFKGSCFPYFVDIICMLINNAVHHSKFKSKSDLEIEINICNVENVDRLNIIRSEFEKRNSQTPVSDYDFMELSVKNTLNHPNVENILTVVEEIFNNLYNPDIVKKYAQTEGGTGLYKIYQTLQFNILGPYIVTYDINDEYFEISIFIVKNKLIERKE